jgi:hypothetical protein
MKRRRAFGQSACEPPRSLEDEMLDTVLLAAGVVGLLLTVAYAYACERM